MKNNIILLCGLIVCLSPIIFKKTVIVQSFIEYSWVLSTVTSLILIIVGSVIMYRGAFKLD